MLRIAWICHFHDEEIGLYLKNCKKLNGFAPWITGLIKLFENDPDIELHIIAPHLGIKRDQVFTKSGVSYYFYSVGLPLSKKYTLSIFDVITDYYFLKRKVSKYIQLIKPDIIHLHGAENAYYSSTIFQFKNKYPILVTIQGFLSHTLIRRNYKIRKRLKVERKILSEFKNYGVRTIPMSNEIKKFNPEAKLHWHIYPVNIPQDLIEYHQVEKKYDCIYFARISKDKGIEDLIDAMSLIKTKIPSISLIIIGDGEDEYLQFLKTKAKKSGIESNVEWKGFIPSQEELFKLVSQAKITVLPTYHDIIPGTIIEGMFLKTAVVAYSVGGIPEINSKQEVIKLVTKGDLEALSDEIIKLLSNNDALTNLMELAYNRVNEMCDNNQIIKDLKTIYIDIVNQQTS
jgi:glycosyltransferase involved in cell wall biosynthesis